MPMIFKSMLTYLEESEVNSTTIVQVNTLLQPKYINCKQGFLRYYIGESPVWLGFTANLRTATPFYGTNGAALDVAKKLMRSIGKDFGYFAIVEPTLIGFDKEKEIA